MLLPIAKKLRYRKGYNGLADALEGGQRKILSEKLWKIAESEWKKSNGRTAPDEVEGLIAVAEKDNNNKKILEIKKKFAMANARYFDELLHYYDKKKDWVSLSGWAKKGLSKSQRSEYLAYFTKAAEKLNDKPAVLDAKIKYFSSNPTAKMLEDIHEYTLNLGKEWETVFEKLFKSAESKEKSYWNNRNLKVKLLLSEGREKEVYMVICEGGKGFDVETVKMLAKFSVARLSSGKELSAFNELKTLDKRCRKEKGDLYEWIRMGLKKEPGVEDSEYAHVAVNMYRILIDFHLTAAKASRAKYAAYYCAVVKELSELTKNPELWRELADYMRVEYKRKRLIWRFLRDRGMLL